MFPAVREFDRVVAENGALLWEPATERIAILAPPPPPALWRTLRAKHVRPLARGAIILATTDPHEPVLRRALRRLAPRFRIVRNRESLMVLPAGVDKASGLRWALADLGISAACTIAIGDGENDVSLLRAAGSGVAVANAVPRLRQRATWVTHAPAGAGVVELIGRLLER